MFAKRVEYFEPRDELYIFFHVKKTNDMHPLPIEKASENVYNNNSESFRPNTIEKYVEDTDELYLQFNDSNHVEYNEITFNDSEWIKHEDFDFIFYRRCCITNKITDFKFVGVSKYFFKLE